MSAAKAPALVATTVPATGLGNGPTHFALSIVAALWPASIRRPTFLKVMWRTFPARVWATSVMPRLTVPSPSGRSHTSRDTSYHRSSGIRQPRWTMPLPGRSPPTGSIIRS